MPTPTLYKWSFDIHTNSFEMFVDDTQFILKNYGNVTLFEYDVVLVVKDGEQYLLVHMEDEPLLKDLWVKLYNIYINYSWEKVCEELKLDCDENGC